MPKRRKKGWKVTQSTQVKTLRAQAPGAKAHMASFLDLPQEVVCDWPRLTLIGNSRLLLENHRGVIIYENDLVRVNITLGQLEITGQDLRLKVVRPDAIAVEGAIKSIQFC
ncbi:sporulation protein YqfC [Thermanaeromonas toyohensis ToBE]|uniref:Sporulation protein YqfC n=1 Tax=Thermanaeromonas toyohensis ToBE TaxID=698762 RepID=A0A1W1VI72_9FIRM|nr:sporulation protein YqfC [Thermanaeromonas toyohensis]SMB92973.1 sporulation protein YqfC [Thermanaeromonas toyohensis ToBE]